MPEPRTAREFADARIVVRVACRCGHVQHSDPLTIAFIYGDDFDIVANSAELVAVIRCEACGSSRPLVTFEKAEPAADFYDEPGRAVAGRMR